MHGPFPSLGFGHRHGPLFLDTPGCFEGPSLKDPRGGAVQPHPGLSGTSTLSILARVTATELYFQDFANYALC